VLVHELLRFCVSAGNQKAADLRQVSVGARTIGILWGAGPERALVQNDAVGIESAEQHRTQSTIAERH
jgi:hypothetical protein